ncbi:MAG: saccharopine dehydrogenase NADP-binding domain-containing protein [Anaerolineales bacterium]|nr:saccharopine dehydrogenase NADP-binding domain-containing protein [Anaerolineales bacterium]
MSAEITIFGATGYTGRLIVAQLEAQLPGEYRLAGRSADKLRNLSASLESKPEWLTADPTHAISLVHLCKDTRVLINCVGPFTDYGEPVVAQAAQCGVHYLDITNEMGYVHAVQKYSAVAQSSGAAIVPACGFEVALADCAAHLLAAEFDGPLDELHVVYGLGGSGSSIGTRRSAIRSLATSWLAYREGEWIGAVPCQEVRDFELPDGHKATLSFPSSEIVTVPQHIATRRVDTWTTVSKGAHLWAPTAVPAFAWLARGPFGALVSALVSRMAPPPETGMRTQAPFTIKLEAMQASQTRTITLQGHGAYDLTAEIAVYAARHMLQPNFSRSGVLAPAQALDPQAFLDHAAEHWNVTITSDKEAHAG